MNSTGIMALQQLLQLLSHKAEKAPVFLKYRSSKNFILFVVSLAVFTDMFLYSVVVPVAPWALESRIGLDPSKVQSWVSISIAVYGAALLVSSPLCGWAADRSSSRRTPLLVGLFALLGATLALCLAKSIWLFVLGRALQGVSASVVWTVGLALLVDTVGDEQIGQAMGYIGFAMKMGILLGPLLGGVVFQRSGYFAVFGLGFAFIGFDIALRMIIIEQKVAVQWDDPTAVNDSERTTKADEIQLQTISESPREADERAHDAIAPISLHQRGYIPNAAANEVEPEQEPETLERPLGRRWKLPPFIALLTSRRLLATLWACVVQATLLTSFDSVLPIFVHDTFHWDTVGAGLIFLPLVIPSLTGPLIGRFVDRYGPKYFTTGGMILACPFLVLLRLIDQNVLSEKVLLCTLLAFIGFAIDLALIPLNAEITYIVVAKEKKVPGLFKSGGVYAQAYGLFNVAYAAGSLLGPLWAGFVTQAVGWGTMAWTLGLFSVVSAVPTFIWVGGRVKWPNMNMVPVRRVQTT